MKTNSLVIDVTAAVGALIFGYVFIACLLGLIVDERFVPAVLRPVIATLCASTITFASSKSYAAGYIPPTLTRISPNTTASTTVQSPPAQPQLQAPTTWIVKPGDCLWNISASLLSGRSASNAAIAQLTQSIFELNRKSFADPNNPNLILPGQVLNLPTI
jgi:hypothetical protein